MLEVLWYLLVLVADEYCGGGGGGCLIIAANKYEGRLVAGETGGGSSFLGILLVIMIGVVADGTGGSGSAVGLMRSTRMLE